MYVILCIPQTHLNRNNNIMVFTIAPSILDCIYIWLKSKPGYLITFGSCQSEVISTNPRSYSTSSRNILSPGVGAVSKCAIFQICYESSDYLFQHVPQLLQSVADQSACARQGHRYVANPIVVTPNWLSVAQNCNICKINSVVDPRITRWHRHGSHVKECAFERVCERRVAFIQHKVTRLHVYLRSLLDTR